MERDVRKGKEWHCSASHAAEWRTLFSKRRASVLQFRLEVLADASIFRPLPRKIIVEASRSLVG